MEVVRRRRRKGGGGRGRRKRTTTTRGWGLGVGGGERGGDRRVEMHPYYLLMKSDIMVIFASNQQTQRALVIANQIFRDTNCNVMT